MIIMSKILGLELLLFGEMDFLSSSDSLSFLEEHVAKLLNKCKIDELSLGLAGINASWIWLSFKERNSFLVVMPCKILSLDSG